MPYRNRTLEQLMRSILESQAAMLSAMTQMQQSLLSGMALHQPHEASGKPEESKPLERFRVRRTHILNWQCSSDIRRAQSRRAGCRWSPREQSEFLQPPS